MAVEQCTNKEGKPGWKAAGGKTCFVGKAGKAKAMRAFAEAPAKKKKAPAKKKAAKAEVPMSKRVK